MVLISFLASHPQVISLAGFLLFSFVRLRSYLHIFQQEEYDALRFVRWMFRTRSFDRFASAAVALTLGVWLLAPDRLVELVLSGILGALLVTIAWRERSSQRHAKKPLIMTARASRIFQLALVLLSTTAVTLALTFTTPGIWLVPIQLCPFFLLVANLMLIPVERRVKKRFWDEAHTKLCDLNPLVVGITGSFGKTSVKHILAHILQYKGQTLATPGSVNTPMGISRVIREQLRASHKFFIVEMGAYGPGSIDTLCRLAPPKIGILTAIGAAHFERFGSLAVTASAKMELANAVIANGGRMVINADVMQLELVSSQLAMNRTSYLTCGSDLGDVTYTGLQQTNKGLTFDIHIEGEVHKVDVPIYGLHQALNVTLAVAAARELGMQFDTIIGALRSVPQITHRLEVKRQLNGTIVIDDAYNSNPVGFESALNLLHVLKQPGAKTHLITPGIVELGKRHDAEHRKLGELAAKMADVIYVVGPGRIPTFVEGVKSSDSGATLKQFSTFLSAYEEFSMNSADGDVLLIENDLPDLYERRLSL